MAGTVKFQQIRGWHHADAEVEIAYNSDRQAEITIWLPKPEIITYLDIAEKF